MSANEENPQESPPALAQLKKEVDAKGPLVDWAIGWLAREDKIVINPKKRSFTIRLK